MEWSQNLNLDCLVSLLCGLLSPSNDGTMNKLYYLTDLATILLVSSCAVSRPEAAIAGVTHILD